MRAATKKSLVVPGHTLAVPIGWGFLKHRLEVGSATSISFLTYNIPLKENAKSNCNEHITITNKGLQEVKINVAQQKKTETITEILIIIVEIK
jgi:hypothetical protein